VFGFNQNLVQAGKIDFVIWLRQAI